MESLHQEGNQSESLKDSLGDYLKHQNTNASINQDMLGQQGFTILSETGGAPNYMTLPGTPVSRFEVFGQFDDEEPMKIAETRSLFSIELSGREQSRVGNIDLSCPAIRFINEDGTKNFKIFLKPKS